METAEFAKFFENIFRAVNIGLVNKSKIIAKSLEVSFREVLNLASSKPFGFVRFILDRASSHYTCRSILFSMVGQKKIKYKVY